MTSLAKIDYAPSGHNNPPSLIDHAQDVVDTINSWLSDHPTIETEDQAREAKPFLDRAKAAFEEMEAERDSKVRPLNEKVAEINTLYKSAHNTDLKKPGRFDRIVLELKSRVGAFAAREEERRTAAAEAARKAQEEAEQLAREAEERERDAIQNAASGELDVNVAEVTTIADETFRAFEKASRLAARAEKDIKVKIGGGFGNAVSLRSVETLHLVSYGKAIKAIGPHDKIWDAILSAARDYRKQHGQLPDGVSITVERKL